MQIKVERNPVAALTGDALVVMAFEGARDERFAPALADLYTAGEIAGKPLEMTLVHQAPGSRARRLLLVGAGTADKFGSAELRRAAAAAVRFLKPKSVLDITMLLDAGFATAAHVAAAVEGALLGDYEPDIHKSDKKDVKIVKQFTVAVPGGAADLDAAAERGRILGESQNLARELGNEPANRMTPLRLAERARQMAAEQGLECEVLDQDRMKQLGMGALLGVAMGSAEPPALIVLRYRPASAKGEAHLGLVGKGVTFDTGGISIKPADGMEKMKYDMMGGAAMIGAMRAIAQLKPPIAVTAFIPAVENMPGSRAQRPGDIVTTLSGKTVEVLNTDAEGRLILADALVYARQQGCTHLIDAATLTGAVVVALGHVNMGAFANNDALLEKLLAAARAEGEKTWPMPMDDEYKELLKSAFADMGNIGGRWGGAISAAKFLQEFADPTPWVHLDIAGTAWMDDPKPYMAKGPTGVGVRTFVNLAMNWNG
jgi:leucyl aminopeptidase